MRGEWEYKKAKEKMEGEMKRDRRSGKCTNVATI